MEFRGSVVKSKGSDFFKSLVNDARLCQRCRTIFVALHCRFNFVYNLVHLFNRVCYWWFGIILFLLIFGRILSKSLDLHNLLNIYRITIPLSQRRAFSIFPIIRSHPRTLLVRRSLILASKALRLNLFLWSSSLSCWSQWFSVEVPELGLNVSSID